MQQESMRARVVCEGRFPTAPTRPRVLVLPDGSPDLAESICEILRSGSVVAVKAHGEGAPDLVIPLVGQPHDHRRVLAEVRARWPGTPVLPVIDSGHLAAAPDASLPGITDFLMSPVRSAELLARVRRLLSRGGGEERRVVAARVAEAAALDRLRGTAPAILRLKQQINLAARTGVTVLLTGETGTGKELTAHALHYLSPRAAQPFLPVNCGALPPDLVENELFGHQRGAYTDAGASQRGLVAEAEGGTLFLDEIDTLALPAQVKLLRFLEDGSYRPLGSGRPVHADVRVVAASNVDLRQKVRAGTFREDLFYRLNVVSLHLPPLRERDADITLLAEHFLAPYAAQDDRWAFAPEALAALQAYAWPGNVRELENVVRHVVTLNRPKCIGPEDLPAPLRPAPAAPTDPSFRAAKAGVVIQFERRYLEGLLQTHRGNVTQAARAARQDRRTFRRLLQKHGLVAREWGERPEPPR